MKPQSLPNKPNHNDLDKMLNGKLPPQALAVERAVIGQMIMFPTETIYDARMMLKPDDFYNPNNRILCKALYDMSVKSITIDLVSLCEQLKQQGNLDKVGGAYYITSTQDHVINFSGFLSHCRIIKQYAMARRMISFAVGVLNKAYSDDIFDVVEESQQALYEMFEEIKTNTVRDITAIVVGAIQNTLEVVAEEDYVTTGFPKWDSINGRLQPVLYVIAARPGMGKTAFVVELLLRMALRFDVLLINGEMSDRQIVNRCVSNLMRFNNDWYTHNPAEWSDEIKRIYIEGAQQLATMKLHIYSGSMELNTIVNMIRFYVRKFGVKAVAIDFVQMVSIAEQVAKYMPKSERLEFTMNLLREVAREENVTIFVLSQLNREVTKRQGSKRPTLADLKGSGALEEYAFQISFLHRPEYYGEDASDEMGETTRGLCYQFIEKHRDGRLEDLKHRFIGQYSKFEEWEDDMKGFNPMHVVKGATPGLDEAPDDLPF